MARKRHDAVARGERYAMTVHIDPEARRLLDQFAPGKRGKGAFLARLLHEHAIREEGRAAGRETIGTHAR